MSRDTTNHNIEDYGAYPFSSDVTYQVGLSVFPHGFWLVFLKSPLIFFTLGSKVTQAFLQHVR